MGEAKRRGNRAERIKQSLDKHRPVPTEQVREDLGFPPTAEFRGYVIHHPEKDEFLGDVRSDRLMTHWGWSKKPEHALRYQDFHEAVNVLTDYGKPGVVIALLFETEDQFYVGWS